MRVTPKQYAIALYESVKDAKKQESIKILSSFVRVLALNNDLSKYDKISAHFGKLWNKEKKIVEAEIKSARKLDGASIKEVSEYLKNVTGTKDVIISEKIDEKVLGGVVIKYGDKILDNSLKTKLQDLRIKLAK